ncbi:RluA family pseudouridine synthase [Sulfoacidibacillus thermotolerans]
MENLEDFAPDEEEEFQTQEVVMFVVDRDEERIDRYLAQQGTWSRAKIQQLIASGRVTVDGKTARASMKVGAGQEIVVRVPPPVAIDVLPEDIELDIRYEDRDLIVVNKPRGMVVHPAPGHVRGTLVGALLGHIKDLSGIGGAERPGIVHRIDKDTSGLLVVAKTDLAHQGLAEQFKAHSVTRLYQALVHGHVGPMTGMIDAPIARDRHKRQQMTVVPEGYGKRAVTHFQVLERYQNYTFVQLRLETGRTHQIRVHMAYIGHPVAGDPVYASRDPLALHGQALHAHTLGFIHPRTGEFLLFEAELPAVLQATLRDLQRQKASL